MCTSATCGTQMEAVDTQLTRESERLRVGYILRSRWAMPELKGHLFVAVLTYVYVRRKMKQKYLMAKIERRRSRRSSEESQRNSRAGQRDAFKTT